MTRPRQTGQRRQWAEAIGLGFDVVAALAVGTVGGHYLERFVTHWSPWTTVIGFILGLGAAIRLTISASHRIERGG